MQHILSQEIRTWWSVIQSTLARIIYFYKHNSRVFINRETQALASLDELRLKRAREIIIKTRLLDLILR